MVMPVQSSNIAITSGWKYRLQKELWYKWKNPLPFTKNLHARFYDILDFSADGHYNWWLHCRVDFSWDGPSGPLVKDRDYLMVPSIPHDVGHWAIEVHGILPESANDMLDKEIGDAVRQGNEAIDWWIGGEPSRPFHAWKTERGTNLVDGHLGDRKPVKIILV